MLRFQRVDILKGFEAKGEYLQFSAMLVMWLCANRMVKQHMAAWAHGEKEGLNLHSCTGDKGGGNALPVMSWTHAQ